MTVKLTLQGGPMLAMKLLAASYLLFQAEPGCSPVQIGLRITRAKNNADLYIERGYSAKSYLSHALFLPDEEKIQAPAPKLLALAALNYYIGLLSSTSRMAQCWCIAKLKIPQPSF